MNFTTLPTLISNDRLANLIKYSEYASRLDGVICECGVYKGGSLEFLSKLNPDKDIFGIDSFAGLPESGPGEFHKPGDFSDVDYVGIVGYFKMLYPNVNILRGNIPEVFSYFPESIKFKFVHLDLDLYKSIFDALTFFVPRLVAGGIIILDDFKVRSTPGCEKAINEYFENPDREVTYRKELKYFDTESSDSHHQYLILK